MVYNSLSLVYLILFIDYKWRICDVYRKQKIIKNSIYGQNKLQYFNVFRILFRLNEPNTCLVIFDILERCFQFVDARRNIYSYTFKHIYIIQVQGNAFFLIKKKNLTRSTNTRLKLRKKKNKKKKQKIKTGARKQRRKEKKKRRICLYFATVWEGYREREKKKKEERLCDSVCG